MLVDQSHNTAPRRSNDQPCTFIAQTEPLHVRTTRACRRTSLCNLRAHSFAATAGTPNRNEQLSMYKNCVIMAAHNASQ